MKTGIWEISITGSKYEYGGGTIFQQFYVGKPSEAALCMVVPSEFRDEALMRKVHETRYAKHNHYYLSLEEVETSGEGVDPNAAKFAEFEDIIHGITYKPGWYFRTDIEHGGPDGSRMWVQVGVTDEADISWDMVAGKKVPWRGAKHYLSAHMCRNEVVSTVYHAVKRAEYHEVDEWFRYAPNGKKPRAIHNPHLDPGVLAEVASKSANFNTRENEMNYGLKTRCTITPTT